MSPESYPPPFRSLKNSTQIDDLDESINPVHDLEDSIPLIDFQTLKHGKQLGEACERWGIFRLINHGVPPTLLSQLQGHAKRAISLPFETKESLITSPLSYFWGTPALTPSGTALSTKGTLQKINLVEGLNVPLGQLNQFQADNPIIASLSLVLEEYGEHLSRLATTIFEAMSVNLGLDPIESKSHLSNSTGFVRVYRYPQCSNSNSACGMDVHTDSSVLSILNQDEVGGLEVLKDNNWFTVKPIPNTLIVNLGDMIQAISDDKYKSVEHRVKLNRNKERISICYFVFPGEGSVIRSSRYKPFTYSDFQGQVQQDIKTIGYKVGLERFKIC